MIRNNLVHLAATAVSLMGTAAVAQAFWFEASLAWSLAFLNHVIGVCLKRHDLHSERDIQRFAVFSMIRLLTLLAVVFIILTFLRQGQTVFVHAYSSVTRLSWLRTSSGCLNLAKASHER